MDKKQVIEQMFEVGAHYGYAKSRRHPSVKPYIFGIKNQTEIIDIEKMYEHLTKTLDFVRSIGAQNGQIMFVGNKPEIFDIVTTAAMSLGMPYSKERWIGGTFTNGPEIRRRIQKLEDYRGKRERNEFSVYTKKERILIDIEIARLERFLGGMTNLKNVPDALFIVDPRRETTAFTEALKMKIPVIGLANSDCDISKISHPIVANDTSRSSVQYFTDLIVSAYNEGKKSGIATTDDTNNRAN